MVSVSTIPNNARLPCVAAQSSLWHEPPPFHTPWMTTLSLHATCRASLKQNKSVPLPGPGLADVTLHAVGSNCLVRGYLFSRWEYRNNLRVVSASFPAASHSAQTSCPPWKLYRPSGYCRKPSMCREPGVHHLLCQLMRHTYCHCTGMPASKDAMQPMPALVGMSLSTAS